MNIFLDIETIPTQRPKERERINESIHPPGNISKAETLANWWATKAPAVQEKAWRDTALSGTWGEIVCVAIGGDDLPAQVHSIDEFNGSEKYMLVHSFDHISCICAGQFPTYIGHNVGFDLRFLYQRAVVHGVKPPHLPYNAPPHAGRYIDTQYEWTGKVKREDGKDFISLVELCRALGIESDDTLTGAEVWDAWQAGEYDKVREHARADVERVRSVYQRLSFSSALDADTGSSPHSTTTPATSSASGD